MSITVRKNFVFDEEIAMHLEELAKESKQSMTSLVQEMVEERYRSINIQKTYEKHLKRFQEVPMDCLQINLFSPSKLK